MSKPSVRMGFSSPRGRSFRSAVSVRFGSRESSRGAFGGAVMALVVVCSLLVAVSPARADGFTWTSRTSAADNEWNSVAYGDGLWVAVAYSGAGNRVMTSPDGIDWTIRTSAADNGWYSVAYGDGLWVAVAYSGAGNRVMTSGAMNVAASPVALPPSVSCVPVPVTVGTKVTCTVTGGDAGIDILWRAAYNPVIAEAGVTLDASGAGVFSFTVPAGALGEELTVELVDWTAPMSLGTVGGPVPTSVPSGGGPVPVWTLGLLALAGGLALRRGSRSGRSAWHVG